MNAPSRTFYFKKNISCGHEVFEVRCKDIFGRDEREEFCPDEQEAKLKVDEYNVKERLAANPLVGTRGTRLCYTDREPVIVVSISKNGKIVTVMDLTSELIEKPVMEPGGFSAFVVQDAKWKVLDKVIMGSEIDYSLRKNGRWVRVGEENKRGESVTFRYCAKYYDYAF